MRAFFVAVIIMKNHENYGRQLLAGEIMRVAGKLRASLTADDVEMVIDEIPDRMFAGFHNDQAVLSFLAEYVSARLFLLQFLPSEEIPLSDGFGDEVLN